MVMLAHDHAAQAGKERPDLVRVLTDAVRLLHCKCGTASLTVHMAPHDADLHLAVPDLLHTFLAEDEVARDGLCAKGET
jgi:hypothetical protein